MIGERAELRRAATLKQNTKENTVPRNFAERKEVGDTRDIIANKIGVKRDKLETIMEIGKLAETGKTKEVREAERKAEEARVEAERKADPNYLRIRS